MANEVTHKLVSAVADLGVAGEASPSDWNAGHNFAGGANGALLVRDSTQSDGANWSTAYPSNVAFGGAVGLIGGTLQLLAVEGSLGLLKSTNPGNTSTETFIAMYGYTSTGALIKTTSISNVFADTANSNGYGVLRLNATYQVAGVQTDENSIALFGGHGVYFWAPAYGTANAPGDKVVRIDGQLSIGATPSSLMTRGITIHQSTNDDEILALQSSDVAHGITAQADTDSFLVVRKAGITNGGGLIRGLTAATVAVLIEGMGTTDNTAKTTAALGYIELDAYKKSGASVTAAGADANLLVITNAGTTEFIWDAEGSGHANIEWVAFGAHDDLALLDALDRPFNDPVKG